jgi:two-component system, sensor histidine kinase and response regulator
VMNGEIGVESSPGAGSVFWFTAHLGKQQNKARQVHGKLLTRGSLEGRRVIIVDDNATNRTVLSTMLRFWGVDHDQAEGGKEALRMMRAAADENRLYDAAIIDMQMPEMDGETLGRVVLDFAEFPPPRLVMMTSVGQRGDAARLQDLGFSAYLTKPVKMSDLHDCLVTVMDRVDDPAEDAETGRKPAPILTRYTIQEQRSRRHRVLVAEDNIVNQKVARNMLQGLGFCVDVAADGKEVLSALRNTPYDLVLMDCRMPELDGYETSQAIRSGTSGVLDPNIPIIALTAHAMHGAREKCLASGMNDYLSKPVDHRRLAEVLEVWLPKKKAPV